MPSARVNDRFVTPRSAASLSPASPNRGARSMPTTWRASSANESGMPPPPHPASRMRPPTVTPACSRNAITFALR